MIKLPPSNSHTYVIYAKVNGQWISSGTADQLRMSILNQQKQDQIRQNLLDEIKAIELHV